MLTKILALLVQISGIHFLIRASISRRNVTVLLYHDPDPDVFEKHLAYLTKQYNVVSYSDVVEISSSGDWRRLPDYPLVLHFDDGYKRNAKLLEACAKFNVRPTLYICSHIVDTNRFFWSKLKDGKSKMLRMVDYQVLLDKLLKEADYTPTTEYQDRQALNQSEIRMMMAQFDIQSHGRFHFSAITHSDSELESELSDSKARVAELSGEPCEHFSFPYGDHSKREVAAVKAHGYKSARTTKPGWIQPTTDLFSIPITADVEGDASISSLKLHVTGLPRMTKRTIYVLLTKHIYALRQRLLMARRFF